MIEIFFLQITTPPVFFQNLFYTKINLTLNHYPLIISLELDEVISYRTVLTNYFQMKKQNLLNSRVKYEKSFLKKIKKMEAIIDEG